MIASRREEVTGRLVLLLLVVVTIIPFLSLFTTALHPPGSVPPGLSWPEEVGGKVDDLLRFGSEQVSVVFPEQRALHQYFADGRYRTYRGSETIDTGDLFQGFTLRLSDLFVFPEPGA